MFASITVNPDSIRETAQQVLSRPYYQVTPKEGEAFPSLVIRFLEWVLSPFVGLFGMLSGVSVVFAWTVFGVVITTVVVVICLVIFRLAKTQRVARFASDMPVAMQNRDPSHLEKLAHDSLSASDYVVAVRLFLMATLLRLELAQEKRFRPGMTNREHLRRYRRSAIFEPMQYIVELMDRTWYGGAECDFESASKCRDAYQEICAQIQRRAHDHGA